MPSLQTFPVMRMRPASRWRRSSGSRNGAFYEMEDGVCGYILLLAIVLTSAALCGCTAPQTWPGSEIGAIPADHLSAEGDIHTLPGIFLAPPGNLTVRFLDVGLGDAILIESPAGKTMLIDAGSALMNESLLSALDAAGVSGLDVVVITHPHEDHIGGMRSVLSRYPVGQFVDSGMPHTTATYESMMNQLTKQQVPYRTVQTGDTITLGSGVVFRVLNPDGSLRSADDNENVAENLNENSVVLILTYGNVTFLFMGDATSDAEQYLISRGATLDADILKVAHHGSSRSSGNRFLVQVSPAVSIIEVGSDNPYGYPALSTLQRLKSTGSQVYRTDLNGTVVVTTDGRTFLVLLERSGHERSSSPQPLPVTA